MRATQIDLSEVARRALIECNGDLAAAKGLVKTQAANDPDLYRAIAEPGFHVAVDRIFAHISRQDRQSIQESGRPSEPRSHPEETDLSVLEAGASLLMSRWMLAGVPGRSAAKASHADWSISRAYAVKRRDAYSLHIHLAEAMLAVVKKGQLTEEVITDEAFKELLEEAVRKAGSEQ